MRTNQCAQNKMMLMLSGLLLQPITMVAAQIPTLIDVSVVKTSIGFGLEPSQLEFHQHQEYLLVITNDNVEDLTFHYNQFGQKILTHYLQGTPSVSQESVDLPAKSKVLWQFSSIETGEFDYYLSNPSLNTKGITYKIHIHPDKDNSAPPPSVKSEEALVTAIDAAEPAPPESAEVQKTTTAKEDKKGAILVRNKR